MDEVFAGTTDEFSDGVRIIVRSGTREIGVFRVGDRFYAFPNRCLHQGGPVCEGIVVGKVNAVMGAHKRELGREFSATELHLVCPWHGWEYNIETGQFAGDPRLRLRTFAVKVEGDRVLVVV